MLIKIPYLHIVEHASPSSNGVKHVKVDKGPVVAKDDGTLVVRDLVS